MTRGAKGTLISAVSGLALVAGFTGLPARAAAQASPPPAWDGGAPKSAKRTITMSVPLTWNGQVLGDVIVQVKPGGSVAIESQSLETQLSLLLNAAGRQRLQEVTAGSPFLTAAQLEAAGFTLVFDLSALELRVDAIAAEFRPVEPLGGRREVDEPVLPAMGPANFSAYLNSTVNLLYRDVDGLARPDVFLSGAARYRGVVLEYEGGLSESSDDYRFYRRAVRGVYDERDKYRRWSAGDLRLENTGALRTPFIAGVAVEKSRRVFDPFTPSANFGGRQILLTSPSTVEVIVNGASYKTLDLQPGTYSLEDLPIQTGSNDVQLLVRDAGGREQVTRFDYFYDPIELKAGEVEYTAAFGVAASEYNLQPDYSDRPVFIGNYRKALSDTFILGGGVQIDQDIQVVSAETQMVPQVIPGSFDLNGAVSTGDGFGFALRGGYRLILGSGIEAKRFTATFNYESKNFRTVGDLAGFRLENLSANATYSQNLSERTTLVAGGNYFKRGGGQSTVYVDVNHRLTPNIRATLGVEYGTGSLFGPNYGIRAGISVLLGARHRADAAYQSRRGLSRASLARSSTNAVGSLGYSLNLQNSDSGASIDGVADYVANRFETRASLGASGNSIGDVTDNRTARLQIGTSFAFADGVFGIGRPIQDAFLLARPHETLRGTDVIAGRSLRDGEYEAASGPLGAAVVNRLSSYNSQDVRYDIDTLEAGYDIGAGVVRVDPPFRSGYQLTVGTDRFVSAVGFLKIGTEPAELAVGLISSADDKGFEPQPFFTNSAGRFGIIGLAPGRTYTVRLNDSGQTFEIHVSDDNTGLYRLGTITLPGTGD
ncbi:fimbria/pilus outer membrane usher protein [Croceibacterium aestuarii]|uniref:fimbria/pilus outer membrane usher protein n=1 Tax=Croceibacterium aestuarii TaxID=3064139 RepID=UPI00272E9E3F|nr:fimbria/pilus outer membrane usher protein [Croceibacterium sp. D39]